MNIFIETEFLMDEQMNVNTQNLDFATMNKPKWTFLSVEQAEIVILTNIETCKYLENGHVSTYSLLDLVRRVNFSIFRNKK